MLAEAVRVEAIPTKRTSPPETRYLEHDEIDKLFTMLPKEGSLALRGRALLMLLDNSGARAQEIADLRVGDVDLVERLRVRLHGKGDKWRSCPLWPQTAEALTQLATVRCGDKSAPLFASRQHRPLTRFGIHKLVKHQTATLRCTPPRAEHCAVSPHFFRHSIAVRLLEEDPVAYCGDVQACISGNVLPTPEPSSIVLLGIGLLSLLAFSARSQRHAQPTAL